MIKLIALLMLTMPSNAAQIDGKFIKAPLELALGTVSAPSYSFSGDPDTGMYSPSSNNVAFAVAGSKILQFSNSGFNPGTSNAFELGSSSLFWSAMYANLYSAQAGLRVHSSGFGTGIVIVAGGLPSPDGGTFTGLYGEGGATNPIGITGGADTGGTAKNVIVQGQNHTGSSDGGAVIIRGGDSSTANGGGITFKTPGTKPTCASGVRGMYWHTLGGTGVKDDIQVCAKDAADAYAWRTIY
jgi:hypothetical protein